MQKARKLVLIGIGYRPLDQRAAEIVRGAEVLLASTRLLEVFKSYDEYDAVKDRVKVIDKVPDTIAFIREHLSRSPVPSIALLASGDPFFFGIGRRMIEEFGPEQVAVLPDLSSMQEAFARINIPWDDAFCISVHGGPDIAKRRALPYEMSDIPYLLVKHGKVAVLTDRQNNPAEIARIVAASQDGRGSDVEMFVCERLGYADEGVWKGTAAQASGLTFRDPNVVVLVGAKGGGPADAPVLGLREEELKHDRGMITKDEIRAVTLHKLRLLPRCVLWDIGACSGSVSLEAARMAQDIRVFAVEKEEQRIETIKKNLRRYGVANVHVVHGSAPAALVDLPAPDRVFIGGSTGSLKGILEQVDKTMKRGIIVINAASLETLGEGSAMLENLGFKTYVSEVSVSRSKTVAGKKLMNALNPVFIVRGERV